MIPWPSVHSSPVGNGGSIDRLVHHAEVIAPQRRLLPAQRPRPRPRPRSRNSRRTMNQPKVVTFRLPPADQVSVAVDTLHSMAPPVAWRSAVWPAHCAPVALRAASINAPIAACKSSSGSSGSSPAPYSSASSTCRAARRRFSALSRASLDPISSTSAMARSSSPETTAPRLRMLTTWCAIAGCPAEQGDLGVSVRE